MMKAAVYDRYGPPEVVKVMDVKPLVCKDNEVLIKVITTTVNRTDCGFRSAEYFISRFWSGLMKPKRKILGCEYAGLIVDKGIAVQSFQTGDRVFGYNDGSFGAHAEFLTQKENDSLTHIPENVSYIMAAPLTEGAHYSLNAIKAMSLQKGNHVLVYGATGAIGSSAVQILKSMGIRVSAVCSTENVYWVKELGVDKVIDYTKEDYSESYQRYDAVLDAVGKTNFGKAKKVLKENGIYISTELGKYGENILLALAGKFYKGKKVKFPIPTISKEIVQYFGQLAEEGLFVPVIDRVYPLDRIVEAYKYVEQGQKKGNVLIKVGSE
ncbi:MAG TPA: NAD(P)-dependent alcohol dehydrogenase [Saprospiraceae bacterium]|nr:NAD(P)-dependent alcohol dehydrogenase [Saprospiraceae bacterium]